MLPKKLVWTGSPHTSSASSFLLPSPSCFVDTEFGGVPSFTSWRSLDTIVFLPLSWSAWNGPPLGFSNSYSPFKTQCGQLFQEDSLKPELMLPLGAPPAPRLTAVPACDIVLVSYCCYDNLLFFYFFIILQFWKPEAQMGLPGLKPRCPQDCIPFQRL